MSAALGFFFVCFFFFPSSNLSNIITVAARTRRMIFFLDHLGVVRGLFVPLVLALFDGPPLSFFYFVFCPTEFCIGSFCQGIQFFLEFLDLLFFL